MKPEVKLKVAIEEIKDILRKYDIAGSVVLHTPGHAEFVNYLLTSYSCAYQYEEDSIRFYSKAKDFDSQKDQHKQQESTANMLRMLVDAIGVNFITLQPLSEEFDRIVKAEHS